MRIEGQVAIVTGGGSGLGAQTARELALRGAKVAVLDINGDNAALVAAEFGGLAVRCDITDTASVEGALVAVEERYGIARILMNVAGVGGAKRIVAKDGRAAPLEDFRRVIEINLIGTYNMIRLAAAQMTSLEAMDDGERGVIVQTASVAAFDGQVGQEAYAASKGGLVSMTLPLARDLAQYGVRVATIAPGLFLTPLLAELPQAVQDSLAASIPFPRRLGKPAEFAHLAASIVENGALNGEVIRLDGALRMAPR
jgi:NAD(P)-dependent dehydrogenase (short-subunit alcohol dehydrogenase family)